MSGPAWHASYGIRDVIAAEVRARRRGHEEDVNRVEAMRSILANHGLPSSAALDDVIRSSYDALAAARSPLDGMLEAPRAVHALHASHAGGIDEAVAHLEQALVALILDAFTAAGLEPTFRFDDGDLQRAGLSAQTRNDHAVDDW